jgi:hypothetical protein
MRVGHEERERLVHVLMQQYAEGRLSGAELEDLSGRARQARTYADLDRLVADLPVTPPSAGLTQQATTANLARLGTDPNHRQTMTGGMSSYVRRGVWTVPAYLTLNAGLATVKLDFQQAVCPHEVVDIAVSAGVGSVVLVVPEGWASTPTRSARASARCRTRWTRALGRASRSSSCTAARRRVRCGSATRPGTTGT